MKETPFMLLPLLIISSMEQRPFSEADSLSSRQPVFILKQRELQFLCLTFFFSKFDFN
jgi:hypothetical protein